MDRVLIIGTGHLAFRVRRLAQARGYAAVDFPLAAHTADDREGSRFDDITRRLAALDLDTMAMVLLVDERDERNLELLIALISLKRAVPIAASLFNENVAPHLQAAHPSVRILNPAKIAAPAFIDALDTPLQHTLRYTPVRVSEAPLSARRDRLIPTLVALFASLSAAAMTYFHFADHLSWLDALYFVVVTITTVGYGDISLRASSATSKVVGIGLIVGATAFIWMIFSLTVDRIIKHRVQRALGRRRYANHGHVILCGLGRLGYFVADGLLSRGEHVLVIERDESSPMIDHLRARGADVYVGDARLPRVLKDAGITRAKALYSVIDNDYVNLEVGLNARSFDPNLRLILRIFDESMSARLRESLDIHLTLSMTALADERFFQGLEGGSGVT